MTSGNDPQWVPKRYVSRRAALRAGILGAALPGILYVAKSAASADAADGDVYIPGAPNFLELGHGWPGKEANAGKISYRRWSDALDIVGAGTTSGYRKVKIWDDLYVQGLVNLRAYVVDPEVPPTWTAFLYARSINGQTKPFWKDTTGTAQPLVARSATLIVAASNASPRSKLGADYVCDGTADEQEINTAIAALPSGGGKLVLTEGTFNISGTGQITPANRLVLEGQGMGQTIIVKAAGADVYTFYLATGSHTDIAFRNFKVDVSAFGATDNFPFDVSGVDGLTLENLWVVGAAANKMGRLYLHDCNRVKILNNRFRYLENVQVDGDPHDNDDTHVATVDVVVQGNTYRDFNLTPPTGGFCIGNLANGWMISGNYIDGGFSGIDTCFSPNANITGNVIRNTRTGIYAEGARGLSITANTIEGNLDAPAINISQVPTGAMLPVDKPGKTIIANNVIRDCGYDAIAIWGIKRVLITGNMIFGAARHGIECEKKTIATVDYLPSEILITNNFIYDFGAAEQWAGSIVCYDADGVLIEGNWIDGKGNPNTYGIRDSAGTNGLAVRGNHITGCTQAMNLAGSNHIIRGNRGHTTENSGTATLTGGTTSIAIDHGLSVSPAAGDIMVTPIEAWGRMTKFWIGNYTSGSFTIYADQDPGQDVDFAWQAVVL